MTVTGGDGAIMVSCAVKAVAAAPAELPGVVAVAPAGRLGAKYIFTTPTAISAMARMVFHEQPESVCAFTPTSLSW